MSNCSSDSDIFFGLNSAVQTRDTKSRGRILCKIHKLLTGPKVLSIDVSAQLQVIRQAVLHEQHAEVYFNR